MRGDFKVMINAGILTTGFNFPALQTVQVLRATVSVPLWLQIIGRGSRIYPGKEYFNILDHGRNGEARAVTGITVYGHLYTKNPKAAARHLLRSAGKGRSLTKRGAKGAVHTLTQCDHLPVLWLYLPDEKERIKAELQLLSYDIMPTPGAPVRKQFEFEEIERTAISRGYKEGWTIGK